MEAIITAILLSFIIPFVFKSPNNLNDENNNNKIIFVFNKRIKNTMLLCAIFFMLFSIFFLFVVSSIDKDGVAISIMTAVLSLFSMVGYIVFRNKKIIYKDKVFYVYNVLGKEKIFNIEDITKVIDKSLAGMELHFKNNKKIKIDTQMTNYAKIKDILDGNGIPYKDKYGNTLPKGW